MTHTNKQIFLGTLYALVCLLVGACSAIVVGIALLSFLVR